MAQIVPGLAIRFGKVTLLPCKVRQLQVFGKLPRQLAGCSEGWTCSEHLEPVAPHRKIFHKALKRHSAEMC